MYNPIGSWIKYKSKRDRVTECELIGSCELIEWIVKPVEC